MSVPPRTKAKDVQAILDNNYGGADLAPYIATASATVDRVATCAARKKVPLTVVELELVERWLAAHNYCQMDPTYSSRSTEGASGSFQGQVTAGIDGSRYGQNAQRIDYSGCLRNLDKQQRASATHLTRPCCADSGDIPCPP